MGVLKQWLRRLWSPPRTPVLADSDMSWFFPPNTRTDASAWDRYWQDQVSHGIAGFADLFVSDGELIEAMRGNRFRRVLCAGNGISHEPRALAWAGFDVTALDLSPLATNAARDAVPSDAFLARLAGVESGTQGGHVEFVVGDLCDSTCCPGPYDVIIERRTAQLWPDAERSAAMHALARRLASRGIFFSHTHDGRWKPPAPRWNAARAWFDAEGWTFWQNQSSITGRVAWLLISTG